jgi:hypothetical protein
MVLLQLKAFCGKSHSKVLCAGTQVTDGGEMVWRDWESTLGAVSSL